MPDDKTTKVPETAVPDTKDNPLAEVVNYEDDRQRPLPEGRYTPGAKSFIKTH